MNLKHLNTKYALLMGAGIAQSVAAYGFSFNYLMGRGFAEGQVGLVLAMCNLLAVIISPLAGDLIDRNPKVTQKAFIATSFAFSALMGVLMIFLPDQPLLLGSAAVLSFASSTAALPIIYSMAFSYENVGGHVNYGVCRAIGSAAFAAGSAILGSMWARFGGSAFSAWLIGTALLTIIVCLLMPDVPNTATAKAEESEEEPVSVLQFFNTYRNTLWVFIALVLLYFCHCVINNYLGAVVGDFVPQGQVEKIQGNALFIQAMVEIPTMACFSLIMKRFSIKQIMAFASIAWSIKHLLILMAHTVPMFYFAMLWQMLSFAAITPALVYYAKDEVEEADINKSQAIFGSALTVGAVLASLAGGMIIQLASVHVGLIVGVTGSILGTVIMLLALRAAAKPKRS